MIRFTTGNLFEAKVEAIVNTVNTVGVMGKGIALQFKKSYPLNFLKYEAACQSNKVVLGKMFVTQWHKKWIINFPTKDHWRNPSKIEWIEEGLVDLKAGIIRNNIRSIAIPPLGAGLGGLDWEEVKGLIVDRLSDLEEVDIILYNPVLKNSFTLK